jgi:chitodextrinase
MALRFPVLLILCLLLGMRSAVAVSPKEATGAAFAASDGRGEIRLIWFPPLGQWPVAGWQVQEVGGKVVAQTVIAEPQALAALDAKDAEAIRRLSTALGTVRSQADAALLYGMVGAQAFGNWDYARAAGLAAVVKAEGRGAHRYRVVGLDQHGRPAQPVLTTPPVDPGVATPLPAPPGDFGAEAVDGGVALHWQPPVMDRELPVLSYAVERAVGDQFVPVGEKPVIRARRWDARLPALIDRTAPLETALTYRIRSVDLFGRQSLPVSVKLYAADLAALVPPLDFAAEAGRGQVTLHWQGARNPHTAGYVLERAFLPGGPYEAITPKGLRAGENRFTDEGLQGGTAYYYRLRMMGPKGDLGPPSRVVMAQPQGDGRLDSVSGVKADVGRTRVRLSWQPLKEAVAGYMVERRDERGGDWLRLQERPQPEPFYDDNLGLGNGGAYSYRVIAIGYDNQESRPSGTVGVELPDLVSPPAPYIVRISGAGGRTELDFAIASVPDVAQFLVLRGDSADSADIVIGDPLPASARHFVDASAEPGQTYWYRLVSVDKAGNRSDPGRAVVVRVGSAEVPSAPKPEVGYDAEPFPHATIRYGAPPAGLGVEVQYSAANQPWLILAGPSAEAGEATHANLPAGEIRYRLVYRDNGDRAGPPSDAVALNRRQ